MFMVVGNFFLLLLVTSILPSEPRYFLLQLQQVSALLQLLFMHLLLNTNNFFQILQLLLSQLDYQF